MILVFSFKPKPFHSNDPSMLQNNPPSATSLTWYDLLANEIKGKRVKVGLVNMDDREMRDRHEGLMEIMPVYFEHVSKDRKWEDFFPEWIDEYHKWGQPECPEIPMPSMDDYKGLDVVVARVPCEMWTSKEGVRDVFRLQVNLVVANLVVNSMWVNPDVDRTVYVVFVGSCGPMWEIFRCDDIMKRIGDYWVYKPDLRRLKHKMLMPVGSCQIAPPFAETGKEVWRYRPRKREAYVTILHSSEAYVCGAIALAQSIIQQNSTRDLVLLHDVTISNKSLQGLRAAGWHTRHIFRIRNPFAQKGSYNEWNYSKLRVWQLTDYDKIIFIDADLLVLENIDRFFVYPQLSAVANDKVLFNSGVMLIEPSMCVFEDLMLKTFKVSSYNGGDQGFLNQVFTWWHRWPSKMNLLKIFDNSDQHQIPDNPYAIHYLGLKPWMCYRDYDCNWDMKDRHQFASDSAHKKWWQVYDAMPKKLQKFCGLTEKMDSRIHKWRGVARRTNLPDGHWKIKITDPRQYRFVK
ncbi:Glyco_transf_8 domain-containing protein [Cephalotus follicularis]|uniref:Hexosyltransferase n=1 Tax=Cephalotus follicularis TaxID=3775 RepID=A0A1Q3B583_CEPFO|nr:Glyco_transf_8 domain-containing protein [Cephalotus follicularis]